MVGFQLEQVDCFRSRWRRREKKAGYTGKAAMVRGKTHLWSSWSSGCWPGSGDSGSSRSRCPRRAACCAACPRRPSCHRRRRPKMTPNNLHETPPSMKRSRGLAPPCLLTLVHAYCLSTTGRINFTAAGVLCAREIAENARTFCNLHARKCPNQIGDVYTLVIGELSISLERATFKVTSLDVTVHPESRFCWYHKIKRLIGKLGTTFPTQNSYNCGKNQF